MDKMNEQAENDR